MWEFKAFSTWELQHRLYIPEKLMPVLGQPNLLQETLHQKDQQFWQLYLGMEHVSWNEYNFYFFWYRTISSFITNRVICKL